MHPCRSHKRTGSISPKALVDHLQIADFHLVGASMGGMIAQEYALAFGADLRSLTLCCTYAAPGPYCSRVFALWQDMARTMGVPAVMRAVTLCAFLGAPETVQPTGPWIHRGIPTDAAAAGVPRVAEQNPALTATRGC
jgi:pimeloyl-ACP methyl ester carboxylesterase